MVSAAAFESLSDEQVVGRVRDGATELFELVIRRYNQRLYRVVRSILRGDEGEIEDVMQQAYVNAYVHLDQFAGRASFATWLTKIAVYEALARAKRSTRLRAFEPAPGGDEEGPVSQLPSQEADPERRAFAGELRALLEGAVDEMPDTYRPVFMLREIEGLSTAETAESLGIREELVKTRLHRAKAFLREHLATRVGEGSVDAFTFHAVRCDRLVARVMSQIRA